MGTTQFDQIMNGHLKYWQLKMRNLQKFVKKRPQKSTVDISCAFNNISSLVDAKIANRYSMS